MMKPLFFLLVLLNVGLTLWEWRKMPIGDPIQTSPPPAPLLLAEEAINARRGATLSGILDRRVNDWQRDEFSRIWNHLQGTERWQDAAFKLAKSSQRLPVVHLSTSSPPTPPPKVQWVCHEIGPFADLPTMKQWLKQKGLVASDTLIKEVQVASDFQVYYPAAKTPEQSQLNKQFLISKGIEDFWLVPSGDNKGVLSLGVFSDHQRAQNFKSQLQAKGITAEIKQRSKTQQQFHAKVMVEKTRREALSGRGLQIGACSR